MEELRAEAVQTRSDFVTFVRRLSEQDPANWENPQTSRYLESLAAWVEDWPAELGGSWSDFAAALVAATLYE